MIEEIQLTLVILGVPMLMVTICWIALMLTMKKTTGELKLFLTPENLVKGMAIIFVVFGTLLLAIMNIIDGAIAGTIFSGIIGYTLGTGFKAGN